MRRRSPTKDSLARNVLWLRRKRGYSQAELALRARVTQALVSAVEGRRANPTVETLERMARVLRVSVADLFTEAET